MNKILIALLYLLLVVAGCDNRHQKRHVKVVHLDDGRYCYYDHGNNTWFWLYMMSSNNSSYSSRPYYTGDTYPTNGSGVSWASSKIDPAVPNASTSVQLAEAKGVESEVVVTDSRGNPEVDADGNLVDPDELNPDESYDSNDTDNSTSSSDSNSDSSSSDSSASDAGDAGSSGGDAGGGGGE